MADDGRVNDARDGTGGAGAFMQRLGKVAPLHQVRKALEELADVNGRAMKIKKTFRKNGDRDDAAGQDGPHEKTTLLDVIDHALT